MTQASYHWARASALNLMGLAALNLHKGLASLCTPARQKSEVCDLAHGSLTSSFIVFYKNSRRTSCKRNSRCSRQAAWITGYVMGKTKPTNISADRLCLAYYSEFICLPRILCRKDICFPVIPIFHHSLRKSISKQ